MSKTLGSAGSISSLGGDGEAEANNSKALSEQGQQLRGKAGEESQLKSILQAQSGSILIHSVG